MPRRPRNLTRSIPWGAGSVRQRGDEWEARWTEGDARPSRPFPTKEAAEDFLIARHRRKLRGGYIAPVEMTVADLLESYIERSIAYGKWKPATINLNRRLADHHILPTLKDLRVIEVEPPRLQRWVDTLARTLSPATVSMCAALLSAAFKQAVTLTIIPSNPCSVVSRPKVEQKPMVTWSVEDIAKVDAFLRDEPKWLAVYRLMLTTGMRPGELYALTWSDLDFEQNIVRIRRTITDNAEGKRVVGATPKGGKTRYVALSRSARAALLDWQNALVLRSLKADTDYVFPSRRGSPMGENVWLGMHAHIIQRTGVPPINLHSLRHTSATLELAAGTPIKIVSERLGHRDPLFTMRIYMHVDANLQRSASDAMDERLFGGS
jgi:integrase